MTPRAMKEFHHRSGTLATAMIRDWRNPAKPDLQAAKNSAYSSTSTDTDQAGPLKVCSMFGGSHCCASASPETNRSPLSAAKMK
jgi:hypothetical protein